MNQNLFRKESMERVTSPDQLNDYIHVAKPGVYLLLSAVIILLLGILCWGVFGKIETIYKGGCEVRSGSPTYIYVSTTNAKSISKGMEASITDGTSTVSVKVRSVDTLPSVMGSDPILQYYSGLAAGDVCFKAEVEDTGLPDGIYQAGIEADSISPISFIIH